MDQVKKRILMFCVSFFGYEQRIADALRNEGYEVDLYDERPKNSFVGKACVRYNIGFYRPVICRHIEAVIRENQGKDYDYVLVVKGEAIDKEMVSLLRRAYPGAKFVLYLWDSVVNIPDCENRMKQYDRVLTFDPQDAQKYSIPFLLIPYDEQSIPYGGTGAAHYDLAFIGTAHSVRPRVVKKLAELCAEQGKSCYRYFYSPHILVYLLNKLTNPDYRWIRLKEIHFSALPTEEVYRIYSHSKCVLDIEHPKQKGVTARTVEMLAMKKKVITTNPGVVNYPFYNRNNFCVIDRDDPKVDEAFWELPYIPLEDSILEQYSPKRFVKTMIGEDEAE